MFIKNLQVEQIRSIGLEEGPRVEGSRVRQSGGVTGVRLEECEDLMAKMDTLMQGADKALELFESRKEEVHQQPKRSVSRSKMRVVPADQPTRQSRSRSRVSQNERKSANGSNGRYSYNPEYDQVDEDSQGSSEEKNVNGQRQPSQRNAYDEARQSAKRSRSASRVNPNVHHLESIVTDEPQQQRNLSVNKSRRVSSSSNLQESTPNRRNNSQVDCVDAASNSAFSQTQTRASSQDHFVTRAKPSSDFIYRKPQAKRQTEAALSPPKSVAKKSVAVGDSAPLNDYDSPERHPTDSRKRSKSPSLKPRTQSEFIEGVNAVDRPDEQTKRFERPSDFSFGENEPVQSQSSRQPTNYRPEVRQSQPQISNKPSFVLVEKTEQKKSVDRIPDSNVKTPKRSEYRHPSQSNFTPKDTPKFNHDTQTHDPYIYRPSKNSKVVNYRDTGRQNAAVDEDSEGEQPVPFTRSHIKSSVAEQSFPGTNTSQPAPPNRSQENFQRDSVRTYPTDSSGSSHLQEDNGPTWSKRDSASERDFHERSVRATQPVSDKQVTRQSDLQNQSRQPSRLSKADQTFFQKLTVTNAPADASASCPDVADALHVVDQFITKNRLTAMVDQAIYNVEDEEFILKFDPSVLQNPEFFRKHHVMQQDGVIYRKFKLLPIHLFGEVDADRLIQKG